MREVPVLATVNGLVFRHYGGAADFAAMARVLNASFKADRIDIVRSADDLARDYAAFNNCDPLHDVIIAEVDGQMVAYARGWWWKQADGLTLHGQFGFVIPAWRRKGLGRAMQDWLERRQRAVAAQLPRGAGHLFHVFVTETERARAALMDRSGYQAARHFFTMVRHDLEAVPHLALPAGLELRDVEPEHCRAIWEAHNEAFADQWGFTPLREAEYKAWMVNKVLFQPQLWRVVWDTATDQIAGQVRSSAARDNPGTSLKRGRIDFLSVRAPWRQRGLGRALISRSLLAQREAGMTQSLLEVDSANATGATRLYESCGFEVVKRNTVYRKPLDL